MKRQINSNDKCDWGKNRLLTWKQIKMANKHLKQCSFPFIVEERQNKVIINYYFYLSYLQGLKRLIMPTICNFVIGRGNTNQHLKM